MRLAAAWIVVGYAGVNAGLGEGFEEGGQFRSSGAGESELSAPGAVACLPEMKVAAVGVQLVVRDAAVGVYVVDDPPGKYS